MDTIIAFFATIIHFEVEQTKFNWIIIRPLLLAQDFSKANHWIIVGQQPEKFLIVYL